MSVIIRKPRLKPEVQGIPRDFAQVKNYFNKALEERTLPWIPRKTPITDGEITKLWAPSLETNITLVAELDGEVVGQGTVFYDTDSTYYEHADKRVPGNMGITAKPELHQKVMKPLMTGFIEELRKQSKTAILTTAKENPGNEMMRKLGYSPSIVKNQKRYQEAGLSGIVYQYNLP